MSIENYPARLTTGFYRVREKWDDPSTQVGAYRILANAMTKADEHPGTFVFAEDGTAIYPEPESGLEEEPVTDPVEDTAGEMPAETDSTSGETPTVDTPAVQEPTEQVPTTQESAAQESAAEEPTAEESAEPDTPMEPSEEFPEAVAYENDGGEKVVAYARLKTLMNIRAGNALDADLITVYRKGTIVEVLQECGNGWLRIKCAESATGFAYVSNEEGQYAFVGKGLYTVAARDNLWKIAEKKLGDGTRYTEIRQMNGLTCNIIRVGMPLILPEK